MTDWPQILLDKVNGDYFYITTEGELCIVRETEEEPKAGQIVIGACGKMISYSPGQQIVIGAVGSIVNQSAPQKEKIIYKWVVAVYTPPRLRNRSSK